MTGPTTPRTADAAAIQAQIISARAHLLGGRGTGASQAEIDQHTRARVVVDGGPTSQHLAAVARQTAIAGGHAAAIALDLAAARAHIDATVQAAAEAIRDQAGLPRVATQRVDAQRRRNGAGWLAFSVSLALYVIIRRHVGRSRELHDGRRTGSSSHAATSTSDVKEHVAARRLRRSSDTHRAGAQASPTPQLLVVDSPGSSRSTPSPVWKAFGGQVIGSLPSPRRRRSGARASPVNSSTIG